MRCYDDVMVYVAEHQDREHRRGLIADYLKEGVESPLLDNILKAHLYSYQKEGALFALSAGRCLIGDDMGLGKTVQALAAAELMARFFHIGKVLVVSPTSLKYQWKAEIQTFTGRKATVIEGLTHQRTALYQDDAFYKLVNYELVWRDRSERSSLAASSSLTATGCTGKRRSQYRSMRGSLIASPVAVMRRARPRPAYGHRERC